MKKRTWIIIAVIVVLLLLAFSFNSKRADVTGNTVEESESLGNVDKGVDNSGNGVPEAPDFDLGLEYEDNLGSLE